MKSRLKKIANLEDKYLDLSEKLWDLFVQDSKLEGDFVSNYKPGSSDPGDNEMLTLNGYLNFTLNKDNIEKKLNKNFSDKEWEEFGQYNKDNFNGDINDIDDFEKYFDVNLKQIILDFAGESSLDNYQTDLEFSLNYNDYEVWIEVTGILIYYNSTKSY